jgi:hypothetical protein
VTMPNIQGSTPAGGGITLRSFGVNRLVLIFPIAEETGTDFTDKTKPKQFMRCNVVALPDPASAPFLTYGGEVLQDGVTVKVPDTMRVDLGPHGYMAENVRIGGGGMLYILRRALATNSARVGRLFKDAQYNNAWKLTDCDNNSPEMAAATQWVQLYTSGNFVNSFPVPINPVPAQPTAQAQSWGAPQQPPAQSWPTNPAPQQQAAPPAWGQPPAQPAYAGPPQQQAPQGWGQPPAQQGTPADQQPHPGF